MSQLNITTYFILGTVAAIFGVVINIFSSLLRILEILRDIQGHLG